ncbi:MAG: hypothetical protein IJQ89_05315 [Bacteroidales bacterium]|nr:hypothetical protein [Bacteroidales bacterium]
MKMKKIILICLATLVITSITSCVGWNKINLSDEPFCKTPIVRAEIQFRIDSAQYVLGWTEPKPYDFQPFVDYLCHCRVLQEPIKYMPLTWVKLYDSDNNEYQLGFSENCTALKREGYTYRISELDARKIKELLTKGRNDD